MIFMRFPKCAKILLLQNIVCITGDFSIEDGIRRQEHGLIRIGLMYKKDRNEFIWMWRGKDASYILFVSYDSALE